MEVEEAHKLLISEPNVHVLQLLARATERMNDSQLTITLQMQLQAKSKCQQW